MAMRCRPLHLFGAIGRERANDQNSVRLYRSRGKRGEGSGLQAQPRSMRLGLEALDASVDLTCGATDGYGVTTPNVKNRTLMRRETGRESRVQVPDSLAAAPLHLWTNYFFAAAIDLPFASVDLSWAAVDDAWACSDCLRASS